MRELWFSRKNCIRNKALDNYHSDEYISGQKLGSISKMKYGLCRMSFNGCECIAVYNAMVYFGKKMRIWEVVEFLERYRMFLGIFGCDPRKIGDALNSLGIKCTSCSDTYKDGAYIISYWTGRRHFSSLHTVFAVKNNAELTVYNRYGNTPAIFYLGDIEDLLKERWLINAYYLGSKTIYNTDP